MASNPEASRRWRQKHPDKSRESANRWRASNSDRVRATKRAWMDANRDRLREHRSRDKAAHAEQYRARGILRRAVNSGLMARPEACSVCGAVGRVHGHHDDYSKPLDVRWLCVRCHKDVHSGVKP